MESVEETDTGEPEARCVHLRRGRQAELVFPQVGQRVVALALDDALDELKKVELLDERDQMREREAQDAAEQTELDAIALMRVRGNAPA